MPIIEARKVVKVGIETTEVPRKINEVAAPSPTTAVTIGTNAATMAPNATIITTKATAIPIISALPLGPPSSIAIDPLISTVSPACRAASATP
ncbi:Uncharacterised protein [Mycobacteroides abscessus subsp. abscessus]|nr:Uncharacterised protein [Mycobacteroides abscessus subsp. abscessus]